MDSRKFGEQKYCTETDQDVFDEDQSDVAYLKAKPGCFIVFGPPGSGKSLVARLVAQFWKCLLITPETVATEAVTKSGAASELKEALHTKDGIIESVAFDLLRKKLESQEVRHYGYVMDDFPNPENSTLNFDEQLEFLRKLEMSIDFVIVMRFPLEDAVRRKEKLYFHGPSGLLIPENFINEDKEYQETTEGRASEMDADEEKAAAAAQANAPKPEGEEGEEGSGSEEGEEKPEESNETDETDNKKPPKKAKKRADNRDAKKGSAVGQEGTANADGEEPNPETQENGGQQSLNVPVRNTKRTTFGHARRHLKPELATKDGTALVEGIIKDTSDQEDAALLFQQMFFPDVPLVNGKMQFPKESLFLRIEDSVEWTQEDYLDYKKSCLPYIENFLASYYPLRVIEIDGHIPMHQIPKLILTRLECLRLQKPPIPHPLTDMVALQRIQEEVPEPEEQCKQALLVGALSPRWKWRKPICGTLCPVSLMEGITIHGVLPFATVFLDRLYLLANKCQQEKFIQNPRLYILPPNPRTPTRFAVFGAPNSGKPDVCQLLSEQHGIKVLDVRALEEQVHNEQKVAFIAAERAAAAIKALELIKTQSAEAVQKARAALETSATELKNLNPDSAVLTELKDILNPNRTSVESSIDVRPPTQLIEIVEPQGSIDAGGPRPTLPSEPPSIVIPPPPAENPPAAPPRESQPVIPILDETGQPVIQPETAPEIPVRVLTDTEQQRLAELEVLLPQLKTTYLSLVEEQGKVCDTYPAVVAEVERLMSLVTTDSIKFDATRYLDLLKEAIAKSQENDLNKPGIRTGSWVLDNLSVNAEAVALLLDSPELFRPTDIVLLKDTTEKFASLKTIYITVEITKDPSYPTSDELWEQNLLTITQYYADVAKIEEACGNMGLRIYSCEISEKKPVDFVNQINSVLFGSFKPVVVEYVEPDPTDEDEEEEEEENDEDAASTMFNRKAGDENSEKSRPLGDTADFCSVALQEFTTLWPGNPEHGLLTYKDKIYSFSTAEAKEKFTKTPDLYVPTFRPFPAPPLRIFVMGVTGSGKTTHARAIADMIDAFLVNVRTYMNELATPKLQKQPVEMFTLDQAKPYWRLPKIPLPNSENLPIVEKQLPTGLVPVKLKFLSPDPLNPLPASTEEQACADSLAGDSSLPSEILTGFLNRWLKEPPYWTGNVVFDGFPMYPDDARFLIEKGIFPDAVFLMSLDGEVAADRTLPKRKAHWSQEKKKREKKRFDSFSNKKREWEKQRATRKIELLAERAASKKEKDEELAKRNAEAKARGDAEEQPEEVDEEEETERIEQQLDDDLPEPRLEDEQGEEESEDEATADERLNEELHYKIDKDLNNIDGIREIFEEKRIPVYDINTSRSELLARKKWRNVLIPLLKKRRHLFESSYPVSGALAKEMLDASYKRLGKFATWCPVKINKGHIFPPMSTKVADLFPVVYRQYLYLCSTEEARTEFVERPEYFVRQPVPRLCIPIRLAVIGPPKSGKTTFAKRLAEEVGVVRISIGDAVRYVLTSLKASELCRILTVYLTSGTDVPDSLEILCLEAFLRTTDCQARGWILDGYPTTINKLNTMMQRFIVPTVVFDLVASNKVCVFRSVIENLTTKKLKLPLFSNSQVVARRLAHYKTNIGPIKTYLETTTRNLIEIDAADSKWKMWYTALDAVANRTVLVQDYVERREKRTAAPLAGLCVTPHQMMSRLSDEYRTYCPISYNMDYALFDCLLKQTYEFIAEYQEKYYLFATRAYLDLFLEDPERWLPPRAVRTIPSKDLLPRIVKLDELDDKWGQRVAFSGLCPVTYFQHDCLYTGLVYGSAKWMVEYLGKIYQFCGQDCQQTFLSQPHKYSSLMEPAKRPPHPEHPSVLNVAVPPIPFLESKIGPLLMQAILEVSDLRPKYPHIGYKESALLFIGNYLKFANLESPADHRTISGEKLRKYGHVSELAAKLILNAECSPNAVQPSSQPLLFDKTEELKVVRKELQNDWHTLCPF